MDNCVVGSAVGNADREKLTGGAQVKTGTSAGHEKTPRTVHRRRNIDHASKVTHVTFHETGNTSVGGTEA